MQLSKTQERISWVFQIIAAIILIQTLFFKFSGAAESVYIFTRMGAEPWGRLASGVFEAIAGILLLIPSTIAIGALLSAGVISGAVFSHLFVLGITLPEVEDNGELFLLAVLVLMSNLIVLFIRRKSIPIIGRNFN